MRPCPTPPRLARLLLVLVVAPEDRPFLLADLEEELQRRADESGSRLARRWYWRQTLGSIAPSLGRRCRTMSRRATGAIGAAARYAVTEFGSDVRYALRTLPRRPLMPVMTVISLGLGIGAVTTAFAVVQSLLWRSPVAIADPDHLATIYTIDPADGEHGPSSFPDYLSLAESLRGLDDLAACRMGMVGLTGPEGSGPGVRLTTEIVTGNYFETLGVGMVLGRGFRAEETRLGAAERVAVISQDLWQRRFAGDPGVIGQPVFLDGRRWTIIGVAPADLTARFLPMRIDVWLPLGVPGGVYHATPGRLALRSERDFLVLGRLREGRSAKQLQAELDTLAAALHAEYGVEWEDERGRPFTLAAQVGKGSTPPEGRAELGTLGGLMFVGTGLVLFLACANVGGLLLARAGFRRREMAVRLALGASRRRLAALLLTESALLAAAGGGLGLLLTQVGASALGSLRFPLGFAISFDFSPDLRVVLFVVLLSGLTCLLFGGLPALEGSKPSLLPALSNAQGTGRRRVGTRRLLVIGQMAASTIFLVLAFLLLGGVRRVTTIDLGFDTSRIAVMSKELPRLDRSPAEAAQALEELRQRLAAAPGVEAAHLALVAEHSLLAEIHRARVQPAVGEGNESLGASYNAVTPGYLGMLGIPLLRGRSLLESDGANAPAVAVVSRSFAERLWPGDGGLGRHFIASGMRTGEDGERQGDRTFEVVGVAEDGGYGFAEGLGGPVRPFFWVPLAQHHSPFVLVEVKARRSVEDAVRLLRREVGAVAGEVNLILPTSFDELIGSQYSLLRGLSRVVSYAGLFGLVLATVGVYGAVALTVARRGREAAIRQALGAGPGRLLRLILVDAVGLTLCGLGIGLAVALPAGKLIESELYGSGHLDLLVLTAATALLLAAAVGASLAPALRLLRLDPAGALRTE